MRILNIVLFDLALVFHSLLTEVIRRVCLLKPVGAWTSVQDPGRFRSRPGQRQHTLSSIVRLTGSVC